MKIKISIYFFVSLISSAIFAQNGQPRLFSGNVYDAFTGEGIPNTKLYLMKSDSTIIDSTTVEFGHFVDINRKDAVYRLKMLEVKSKDRQYIIKAFHPQYATKYLPFSTKKYGRRIQIKLPDIAMNRTASIFERSLDEVVVSATKVKVYYKGDTIVYNADAFNVSDGSMLDELIRQMPGTELRRNGEIFVNGRKVAYLLLNGQDFFRGRNKLMLENLPYYTVENIKVYDKTTDKATALNDINAPKDYVMDVNLKKEYRTGYIANLEAGGGNHASYLARLFGLRYSDHARLTLIGNSNNTNISSMADNMGEFDYNVSDEGITTSHSVDFDWLLTRKNFKNNLEVSYNNERIEDGKIVHGETFLGAEGSTYSFNTSSNFSKRHAINANNTFTLKNPFWLEIKTAFSYRNGNDNDFDMGGNAFDDIWHKRNAEFLDSLLEQGIPVNTFGMLNANLRKYQRMSDMYLGAQSLDIAKNLENGDVVNLYLSFDIDDMKHNAARHEKYLFFQNAGYEDDRNESIMEANRKIGFVANLSYKLINLWKSDWTLFSNYRYGNTKSSEQRSILYTQSIDNLNSYDYSTNENMLSAGLSYSYAGFLGKNWNLLNIRATLPMVMKFRNSKYRRHVLDTCIVQEHISFEPSLGADYTVNKNTFALSSSYSCALPDVTQLVPMPITSDPLNRYVGNTSLKATSYLSAKFSYKKTLKKINYWTNSISYTRHFNQIVNSYTYFPENGSYLFKPINTDGSWNITYENNYWNYLKESPKGKWTVNWDGTIRYAENANYFAVGEQTHQERNTNKSLRISMPFSFGYFHKDFECMLLGRFAWNHAFNNTSDVAYSNAFDYGVGIDLKKTLFWNITASTVFNINMRSGYSGTNVNKTEYVWDFSASKSFLGEKLVVRLKAVDVLRNRSSLNYIVNNMGVSEIQKTKLPGYLLLSVSYRFNKNPKSRN